MDNATRLQYLEAMGIDVWVLKHRPAVEQARQAAAAGDDMIETVEWASQSEAHSSAQMPYDQASVQSLSEAWVGHDETSSADALDAWASLHLAQPMLSTHADEQAWHDLQHEVSICRACELCETRTQTVFGVGNHHASWMLIGEAPGQNEDLQGEPFVGKAGQLLTEMLRAIGLKREEVFIANMLKCRPPNNRDPQAGEIAACHDFLQRQIELLQPKLIVAVGRIAAQNLLKTQQPLAKLRGVRHRLGNYPLVVVHHPAYLLRALSEKAKAWDDLQFALSVYQSLEQ